MIKTENSSQPTKLKREDFLRKNQYVIKEEIVFCVELTDSILKNDPILGHSQLEEILIALQDTMASLVISLPNTGVGCYLFNVSDAPNGIQKLIELKDLNAPDTKTISDILEDHHTGRQLLRDRFKVATVTTDKKSKATSNLFDTLNLIQDDFLYTRNKYKTKPYTNKKIFLFTDNDKPYNGNYQMQLSLKKLLRDFQDSYINITPFFITDKANDERFDKTEYDNILFQYEDEENDPEAGDDSGANAINKPKVTTISSDKIRSKISRVKEVKRVQFTCSLDIAPEITVSVKGFSTYTHEKTSMTSSPIKAVSEHDAYLMVNGTNVVLDEMTGADMTEAPKMKCYKVGEDLIPFTTEELDAMKTYGEESKPILKLIGFRSIDTYLRHYNIAKSTFIAPDPNGSYTHSQRTLSCLYISMLKKQKYAIVYGFLRSNSSPGLYSMVPSALAGGTGATAAGFPEGFFLSRIPFRDEVRLVPNSVVPQAVPKQDLVQNFELILKRFYMRKGYVPQEYANPQIQWHFKMIRDEYCQQELEPGALNEENEIHQAILNKFDSTKQKVANVRNAIVSSSAAKSKDPARETVADLIKSLNSKLNKLSIDDTYDSIGNNNKRVKKEAEPERELKDLDILRAYKENKLNSFKLSQLRLYIKQSKIPIANQATSTKKELIEQLSDFLSTKNIKI